MASCTSLTVMGCPRQTAFMMSSSRGVKESELFRVRIVSSIFKKLHHLPRALFSGGMRRNRADTELQTTAGHTDFDSVADSNLASRPCFSPIDDDAAGITHLLGQSAAQYNATPL